MKIVIGETKNYPYFACHRWSLAAGDSCFVAATVNEAPGSWHVTEATIKQFEIEILPDGGRCFVRFTSGTGVYYEQVFKSREAAMAVAAQWNEEGRA